MSEYSVRINRSAGSVEISGPEESWVTTKLKELEYIYKEPPVLSLVQTPASQVNAAARPSTTSSQKPARKSGSSKRPEVNSDLLSRLTSPVVAKLTAYIAERQTIFDARMVSQAIIIALFLEDELQWKGVDHNDLYTVYRQLGLITGDHKSQLRNAFARDKYFSNMKDGKFFPSTKGETFARHGSKNAEA